MEVRMNSEKMTFVRVSLESRPTDDIRKRNNFRVDIRVDDLLARRPIAQ